MEKYTVFEIGDNRYGGAEILAYSGTHSRPPGAINRQRRWVKYTSDRTYHRLDDDEVLSTLLEIIVFGGVEVERLALGGAPRRVETRHDLGRSPRASEVILQM